MITGVHALIYTKNADEVRAFFRDVLGFASVNAGEGWLIFALPPAELGVHPSDGKDQQELFLMCDDLEATMIELKNKGVVFTRGVVDEGWGLVTSIKLPGGSALGLYQPRHPTAFEAR